MVQTVTGTACCTCSMSYEVQRWAGKSRKKSSSLNKRPRVHTVQAQQETQNERFFERGSPKCPSCALHPNNAPCFGGGGGEYFDISTNDLWPRRCNPLVILYCPPGSDVDINWHIRLHTPRPWDCSIFISTRATTNASRNLQRAGRCFIMSCLRHATNGQRRDGRERAWRAHRPQHGLGRER